MYLRNTFFAFLLFFTFNAIGQDFVRIAEIPVPQLETGFGNFIAGVDLDGDGKPEIYAVNNNWNDDGEELIPKIYKYELDGTTWNMVWSATLDIPLQNTWPTLAVGDLDGDGKKEIIWGPVNFTGPTNPNPARIIVFEYPGDGSNNMGVDNFGTFIPNATWTIVNQNDYNLRPFRWEVADIDSDGKEEIVFVSRVAGERFGVVSVNDIPDLGGGTETWTLEASGLGQTIDASTIYDMAILGSTLYIIHSNGVITPVTYSNGTYTVQAALTGLIPGGSWKSASVVDIDGNGTKEIVVGGWLTGADNKVWVLQESTPGTLSSTQIGNFASVIGAAGRINGGFAGDIDGNGKVDFVFGTRGATPDAAIVRFEYLGGDITNASNYKTTVIDSLYPITGGRWDLVSIANVDNAAGNEVIYSNGIGGRAPIVILKYNGPTSVENDQMPNSFYVDQNYPNPFNPSTAITFGLTTETLVSIRINNLLGQEVAVLMENELRESGNHKVMFYSSGLPSGHYIYTVQAGENVISKKMTLLK